MYVFDYGAASGFRLALAHPERVAAIISQNGNAYLEGLGNAWNSRQTYWRSPTPEKAIGSGFLQLRTPRNLQVEDQCIRD
jgi:pimeloyl-ACP methyl ester carboxylesterase